MNVTTKTNELVKRWIGARKAVARTRADLNAAECELANACSVLGEWLVPDGFTDEKFNIWFGSGTLQAIKLPDGNYKVSWLKEPDGKDRIEFGV